MKREGKLIHISQYAGGQAQRFVLERKVRELRRLLALEVKRNRALQWEVRAISLIALLSASGALIVVAL